jgi:hypothetical protein
MMTTTQDDETTVQWPSVETTGIEFRPGDVIDGRYVVRGFIGRGGMGMVLRVEARDDGKVYALKYCHPDEARIRRFAREVRLMQRVRHAHVVPIVAANLEHDPPYFLMPMAEGSLEHALPGLQGREAEALAIFRQVCRGVQAMHDSGIVHRDLKPANVLRFAGGRIAVSDLGAAKLEMRDTTILTRTIAVVGTLAYLAPEQLLPAGSRGADIRTDVFQLGKVLYQMITGETPVLIEPSAVPTGLAHILQRATSVNPDDRYQDLDELLDALRYYELSKDPDTNTREALENLVVQAEDRLRRGEPFGGPLREILALLVNLDRLEPAVAIESFDRIPDGLLPDLAHGFPGELLPVLRAYCEALRSRVARANFGYADTVARRMRIVFTSTRQPELKTLALQTTLIVAVALNRYAAMGVFNRLLMDVRTADLAIPIAEMLRDHAEYYHEVATGAPSDRLHPAIRDVQQEILTWNDIPF